MDSLEKDHLIQGPINGISSDQHWKNLKGCPFQNPEMMLHLLPNLTQLYGHGPKKDSFYQLMPTHGGDPEFHDEKLRLDYI